jgi:hypothetical protein
VQIITGFGARVNRLVVQNIVPKIGYFTMGYILDQSAVLEFLRKLNSYIRSDHCPFAMVISTQIVYSEIAGFQMFAYWPFIASICNVNCIAERVALTDLRGLVGNKAGFV